MINMIHRHPAYTENSVLAIHVYSLRGARHDSETRQWLLESSGITSEINALLESESNFSLSLLLLQILVHVRKISPRDI